MTKNIPELGTKKHAVPSTCGCAVLGIQPGVRLSLCLAPIFQSTIGQCHLLRFLVKINNIKNSSNMLCHYKYIKKQANKYYANHVYLFCELLLDN